MMVMKLANTEVTESISEKKTMEIVSELRLRCDEIVNVVYSTTDYERFHYYIGNRDICGNIVSKLKSSIRKYGFRGSCLAVMEIENQLYIIDGQHRFEALKQLGQPIPYMIVMSVENPEAVAAAMNQSQHNWSTKDFINSYAAVGNESYSNLLDILTNPKYKKIPIGTVCAAITKFYANSANGYVRTLLLNGKLKFSNEQVPKVTSLLDSLLPIIEKMNNMEFSGKKDLFLNAVLCANAYGEGFSIGGFGQIFSTCSVLTDDRSSFENCLQSVIKIHNKAGHRMRYKNIYDWNKEVASERAIELGIKAEKKEKSASKKERKYKCVIK